MIRHNAAFLKLNFLCNNSDINSVWKWVKRA